MSDDLISKEKLLDELVDYRNILCTLGGKDDVDNVIDLMLGFETVDAAPVRHGRWIHRKHRIFGNTYDYECSVCGCDYALAEYNFCPNCGAKTDGDADA